MITRKQIAERLGIISDELFGKATVAFLLEVGKIIKEETQTDEKTKKDLSYPYMIHASISISSALIEIFGKKDMHFAISNISAMSAYMISRVIDEDNSITIDEMEKYIRGEISKLKKGRIELGNENRSKDSV